MVDKCKVKVCAATSCMHNKNKQCILEFIVIDRKGQCEQFNDTGRTVVPKSKPKDKPKARIAQQWQSQLKPEIGDYERQREIQELYR